MKSKVLFTLFMVGLFVLTSLGSFIGAAYAQDEPVELPDVTEFVEKLKAAAPPTLSEDGLSVANGVTPLVVVADPNPETRDIRVPQDQWVKDAIAGTTKGAATFQITYIPAGQYDFNGKLCYDFPAAAKTAFNAAAAIWASKLQSSVPIKIKACWADLGSTTGILGYSGGAYIYRDYSGLPIANTWYEESLANSLHGSDLGPDHYDDNITYNKYFTWYYGTDGNTPSGQYDLVTVAAHEIAHGLNFSGSANVSGSNGYWGYSGYPYIYDRFMESSGGTKLTSYTSGSTSLGTLLRSNALYWNGTNANAANGGARVKMYAPSTWRPGSSYSHLDYDTFKGTVNSMMVYAVSSGSAQHNPGPVTLGILKDMGWKTGTVVVTVPKPISPAGTITDKTPTYKWTKVAKATKYQFWVYKGTSTTPLYKYDVSNTACGTTYCTKTPTTSLALASYKWKARAYVGGVWKAWSPLKSFTIANTTGFNSQFTSNATGWSPVNGTWKVASGYYQTAGVYGKYATSKHSNSYGVLTYTAKLKRTGNENQSQSLWFNGAPTPINSVGNWNNGYFFGVVNSKYFLIGMMDGGTWYPLMTEWTYSSAISSTWNTLKVTYNKSTGFVQFFINGTKVANGTFGTFTSGAVGLGMYQEGTANLSVDWATLTTSAPKSAAIDGDVIVIDDAMRGVYTGPSMIGP